MIADTSHRFQDQHIEVRERIDLDDSLAQLDRMQAELLLSPREYSKDNRVPCSGQLNINAGP